MHMLTKPHPQHKLKQVIVLNEIGNIKKQEDSPVDKM